MFIASLGKARGSPHQRDDKRAGGDSRDGLAAVEAGPHYFPFLAKELELQALVRTGVRAVHTHVALCLTPRNSTDGIVAALAMHFALIALVAGCGIFMQPEDRPPRDDTEQASQRTERATPEARHAKIEG